jgi:hypothetical protein
LCSRRAIAIFPELQAERFPMTKLDDDEVRLLEMIARGPLRWIDDHAAAGLIAGKMADVIDGKLTILPAGKAYLTALRSL